MSLVNLRGDHAKSYDITSAKSFIIVVIHVLRFKALVDLHFDARTPAARAKSILKKHPFEFRKTACQFVS